MTVTLFSMLVTSTLSYIWQFSQPPNTLTRIEMAALDRAFHLPSGSVPPAFFKEPKDLGGTHSITDISLTSAAARLRVFMRLPNKRALDLITTQATNSDLVSMNPSRKE